MSGPVADVRNARARFPRAIASYEIQGRLGKGAMGIVYHAIDSRSGQPVALKVVVSGFENDDQLRARFLREAVVAGGLRHRNIVSVLDSGEDDGRLYLAMELLSGMTLGNFLQQPEAADLELRLDLMIQICQGLKVAHDAGVFHRDIKPSNLFITADHRVKILDFGVARLADSNITLTGDVLGTPDFMSPEQARGQEVDQRSDVFSAGVVFYVMLTGRKPFAADDLPAVLTKVLSEDPQPIQPDEAPLPVATVVHKALSKNVDDRYEGMAQFSADLMRASDAVAARTRLRSLEVRAAAEGLVQLDSRLNARRDELGLTTSEPSGWQELTERYPVVRRGPGVLGVFPLRAALVDVLAAEVDARLADLSREGDVLDAAHAEWSRARALLDAGDATEARERLVAARRLVPESPVVHQALERCTALIEERQEQQSRFDVSLRRAEEAAARRDWEAVLAAANELDGIVPANADGRRLRQAARRNIERDRKRAAREQANQQTESVLGEARQLVVEGRFDDAISRLEAHLLAHPAAAIREAIEFARSEQEQARIRQQRLEDAARRANEAQQALSAGELDRAARAVTEAVSLNGNDAEIAALHARIDSIVRARDERAARARRVEDLLARAKRLADRGRLAAALEVVDDALGVDAERPEAQALRARLVTAIDELERQAEAAALYARQQRAAAPALREAGRALAAGDYRRARAMADVAQAQAPQHTDVRALIEEIAARTPPPSDDDTQRVAAVDDREETARLVPSLSSWRDAADQVRHRALAFVRRWLTTSR